MRKIALLLAFAGPPMAPLERLLYSYGIPEVLPYPQLAVCLPALLFGLWDWMQHRSFVDSLALWLCVGLGAASLLWVEPSEQGRGMLIVAGVATGIPISVTVRRFNAFHFCVSAFVFSSLVNLGLMAWNTDIWTGRLGELVIEEYEFVSNPNAFGGLMAAAAIMTVAFFVIDTRHGRSPTNSLLSSRGFALTVAGIFYVATLLSASRGSVLCLAIVTLIFLFGRGFSPNRVVSALGVLAMVVVILTLASDVADSTLERFSDGENVASLGGRLAIWTAAVEAFRESPWIGVGVGGVERMLAEFYPYRDGVMIGEDDVRRRASHNSYVEWVVSLGLLGVLPAAWLISKLVSRAIRVDREWGTVQCRALVGYCCLFSISTTVYRLPYWIPIAAIVFAALSARRAAATKRAATDRLGVSARGRVATPMRRRLTTPRLSKSA